MTTIVTKNGSGAPTSGDLVQGELAVDLTNKRLYTEDSGGSVIEVGSNPTTLTTGTFTSTGIDDNATSTAITIDASENVGIGTTSPDINGLHIAASSAGVLVEATDNATPRVEFVRTGGSIQFSTGTDSTNFLIKQGATGAITTNRYQITGIGDHRWYNDVGTERMRIDSAGNVGIGNTAPTEKLTVGDLFGNSTDSVVIGGSGRYYSSGGARGSVQISSTYATSGVATRAVSFGNNIYTRNNGADVSEWAYNASNIGGSAIVCSSENNGSGEILFFRGTDPDISATVTESMRIDESGNLMVGTTTSNLASSGCRMSASGRGSFNSSTAGPSLYLDRSGNGEIVYFAANGSDAGGINVTAGGTPSFSAASDIRLKENLTDHEPELANLMTIRTSRWDWKDAAKGSGEGVIAQELEQTAWADLVTEREDGYKQVSGFGVVETRLVKAIQEQQEMIDDLRARVATLEARA